MDSSLGSALTPHFVQHVISERGAPLPQSLDGNKPFCGIVTDSRKVKPGCLFVALAGDQWDGHDFLDSAISQGALGLIYEKGKKKFPETVSKNLFLYPVDSTLDAYRLLGAAWRKKFSIPVLAVAGSAGKTTTKELLAAILRGRWEKVLKTQASQNGFIGIPMTLLELSSEHEAAVIEIGIDEIGAMQKHLDIVKPTSSIVTSIGPEHLEKLRDVDTVAHEEILALSEVAKSGGIVAVNFDDPRVFQKAAGLPEELCIPYSLQGKTGKGKALSSHAIRGRIDESTRHLTFEGNRFSSTTLELPLPGVHNASNLLGAIAMAAGLGFTAQEIQKGLTTFRGAEGRSDIQTLAGPLHVVCDYYNAQPMSMNAAFSLLAQTARLKKSSNNWACLADMLELGPQEEKFHRELAPKIIEAGLGNVLLTGPRMKALEDELKKSKFSGYLAHFPNQASLTQALTERVRPGDSVLIKGSRSMKMEEVWKILKSFITSNWSNAIESKNSAPSA